MGKSRFSEDGESNFVRDPFVLMASSTEEPEGKRESSCCSETLPERGKTARGREGSAHVGGGEVLTLT